MSCYFRRVQVLKFTIQLLLAQKSGEGLYGPQFSYFLYIGFFKYLWACFVTEYITGTTGELYDPGKFNIVYWL